MTQVKLWQIVSQSTKGVIFSDADGNLQSLGAGGPQKVLVSGPDGSPMWADNSALVSALQAQTDAANALATANAYTNAQIAALVDNAPIALNTLNELAVKLNGEDSAINALLLQVDGKADKTDVNTLIGLAKQDVNSYTDQKITDALVTAGQDADSKARNAINQAVSTANAHADYIVNNALATASSYAQQIADEAKELAITTASDDATAKVTQFSNAIPETFWVEGNTTACFLASSLNLTRSKVTTDGLVIATDFTEVTGAQSVADDRSLNAKLLFINGVAMSDEWSTTRDVTGKLIINLTSRLADHVFDGTHNSIMVLAEYKIYNKISRIN